VNVGCLIHESMGLIKDEPDSGSEACVTALDDGSEEGNIKVEKAIDIKEKNPEVIFAPIKTEPEVSVWGMCVRQQQFMFLRPFTATKREHTKIHFIYLYICTVHFV